MRPIISTKNVVELSGILAASTNTVNLNIALTADTAALATSNSVERGAKINGIFFSCFWIAEGGEVAAEVPLVDWYIIKDPGGSMGSTFDATHLPTPGASGVHDNKRFIIHTEKGLAGGGDASTAGVPMVFKGVIVIPKGYRKFNSGDLLSVVSRANFNTKFCMQAIYRWYH